MSQVKQREPEPFSKPLSDSTHLPAQHTPQTPFAKFDDRIEKASDRIFPRQPYLITIPSEKPYRRHVNDQTRWYLYTPFHKKEEQLQYMSFLLHQSDDEVLMRVDGTRIDDDGRLLPPAQSPRSESQSRPQTPVDTGPKKKISLKDYKTKDKSTLNTPDSRPADDMRRQAMKSSIEEVGAKIMTPEVKLAQEKKVQVADPVRRPQSPVVKEEFKSVATPTLQDSESQRPAKRRRLSAEDNKPASRANGAKATGVATEKRELPTLLSPVMPASEKTHNLPTLLSPKLPLALEKAVKAPPMRSEEVKNIIKAGLGSPAGLGEKKSTDGTKDSSVGRIRSESQLSVKSLQADRVPSPVQRPLSSASNKAILANGSISSPKPRQRHIIVLRYGKKNRKRVQMLLKLEPTRPKKEAPVIDREREREKVASKSLPKVEPPKPEKKRPTEPSVEVPVKKPKLGASLHDPPTKQTTVSTPKQDVAKSPIPIAKQKSAFSTPKKDVKSAAMQRVASSDTVGVRTPSQDMARTSTPLPTSHSLQPKTSPAPTSTPSRTDDFVVWTEINAKVHQIGRALKKDGSKLAAEGKGKEQARGVVLLIEGLVCFMLNSAAQAQARPGGDPGWSTILPYHFMVSRQSRGHRHLHGLVTQLGAVCRQYLSHELIKRLSKETLPDDHMTSAPTPGNDGSTKGMDDGLKRQKSFIELRDELVKNSKELRSAWLESPRLLPPDAIEDQYPSTWSKRTKDLTKRNPDRINVKEITKDYYIPIDVTTNVFEASNFALAFLHEWTMIEGVQWKTQIDLRV